MEDPKAPKIILKLDAGVSEDDLDDLTHELIDELSEVCGHEFVGPLKKPAPEGERAGLEIAVLGAILLYVAEKVADDVISKIVDAIWDWMTRKKRNLAGTITITLDKGGQQNPKITSDMPKDKMIEVLKATLQQVEAIQA